MPSAAAAAVGLTFGGDFVNDVVNISHMQIDSGFEFDLPTYR